MAWRDQDTLQLGIDPRRAVALTGLGGAAAVLGLLDGSRDHAQVLVAAHERGIPRDTADRVIALLAAAGVVEDFPAAALRALPDGPRARLACELASASLAHGHADGGARILSRRQGARVRVYGTGPVGSSVASLLTASGVGRVSSVSQPGRPGAGPSDIGLPDGGLPDSALPDASLPDLGPAGAHHLPRAAARTRSDRRPRPGAATPTARPRARASAARPGQRADLAILAGGYPAELPGELTASGTVHLAVSASEAIGVVGPLVIPGRSACLGCLELARRDRDPAWPLILAQVTGRTASPVACGATLVAAVAAQAAGQALSFIDLARPADAVTNGTLELVLPGWQWRRRSWTRHPRCRCSRRPGT